MFITAPKGHLSRTQKAIIEELFQNRLTETELLEKYKIKKYRFRTWLKNGLFLREINERIDAAFRQSRLVVAHWLPIASERLAQLTVSEKDETARKACLDLMNFTNEKTEPVAPPKKNAEEKEEEELEFTTEQYHAILNQMIEWEEEKTQKPIGLITPKNKSPGG